MNRFRRARFLGLRCLLLWNIILNPVEILIGFEPDQALASASYSSTKYDAATKVQSYLAAIMRVPNAPENENLLVQDANEAISFLQKNPEISKSLAGWQLLTVSRNILNYSEVKKNFKDCGKDSENIGGRILALTKSLSVTDGGCPSAHQSGGFSGITETIRYSGLQDEISKNAIIGAVDKYFEIKYKYDNGNTTHLLNSLCGSKCTERDRTLVQKRIDELNARPKPKKLDVQHQFFVLNEKLVEANSHLVRISVDTLHPSSKDNPDNQEYYQQYEKNYLEALGSESGFLLNTQTMQNFFGEFRTFDHGLQTRLLDRGFDPHHTAGSNNENLGYGPQHMMVAAIKEAESTIEEQFQEIATQDSQKLSDEGGKSNGTVFRGKDKSEKDLMTLVETNPVAVAQALLDNPYATKDICNVITKLNQQQASRVKWHKVALWSVGIAAAALAVTGVGLGAAVWLAGGMAAATVAAPTLVAATVVIAGGTAIVSGIGATEATVYTVQTNQEYALLRKSFVAGSTYNDHNTQIVAGQDVQASLNEYYKAKNAAIISGATFFADALGFGLIKSATDAIKIAKAANSVDELNELKAATQTLNDINAANKDGELTAVFKRLASKDVAGEENANSLVRAFTKASENMRVKILEKMKSFSNKTLKKFAEDILKEAPKCG